MLNPAVDLHESRSRDRVLEVVSAQGPISASALAAELGLTDTAIRRHLDNLEAAGHIVEHEPAAPRGRGRPARRFVVSETGHRTLASGYDDLAGQAIRFLAETAGVEAVEAFAARQAAGLESRYAARVEAAGPHPEARAEALVAALTADGYSATARPVPATPLAGIQVCQGHCPVQDVAEQFPQFCEAETEAFSRLLGVHVQRLATLAHGDHACTTFVPTPAVTTPERSSS